MKWLVIWCSLISFCAARIASRNSNEDRILGGKEVEAGKFLFVPQILMFASLRPYVEEASGISWTGLPKTGPLGTCTATIISKRHLLTAAHCVYDLNFQHNTSEGRSIFGTKPYAPVFVDVRPNDNGKWSKIRNFGIGAKYYVHRSWGKAPLFSGDVAIIELSENTDMGIAPVTLAADYADDYEMEAIATGYGNYKFNFTNHKALDDDPPELQSANVSIHPMRDCIISNESRELYDHNEQSHGLLDLVYDSHRILCAGNYLQRVDHGDSGGPLLAEVNGTYYQIGVASYIGVYDEPGSYSRVSYYCGWIEMITKGEAKCQPFPKKTKAELLQSPNFATSSELTTAIVICLFTLIISFL